MKVLKIIAGILGATFTLAILIMIAIITFISPEQFRQQISTAISEKTGKPLVMEGKLHWNIYPKLGITADHFLLKDEAIFKDNFASADSITVYVKLKPLLHKQLIISSIQIEGLKLNLTTLANGQSNWKIDHPSADKKAIPEEQKSNATATEEYQVDIHQLEITNGQVNYRDQQNGKAIQLNDLALTAKHLGNHATFPIDANFELTTNKKNYHSSINTKLNYDDTTSQLTLTDLNISSVFSNETIKFNTEKFLMNFKTNHVTIPSYTVHYSDLNAKGSLETDHLSDKTTWKGSLITQPFNLRALTKKTGQPLKIGSADAFTHVQLNSKFTLSPTDIHFSNLAGKIDAMDVSGSITYRFSPSTIQLSLYTSQLNLDNYLSSHSNNTNPTQSNNPSNNPSSSSGININGDIGVGTFVTDGITLTQVKSNIQYQNHAFKADNFRASVFGGSTQGSITINLQSKTPNISLQQNISNIDMQQLQKVLIGAGKMSGRGNVQTNISFTGTDSKAILRSMKGTANLTMTEGQFYGADIDYQLSKIRFTLMKLPGTGEQDRGYTPFSHFRADITFNDGILRNSHLEMNSPTLSIVGDGSLNMINKTLDYRIGAQSLRKMDIKTDLFSLDLAEYRIPALINGSMDKPNVNLDMKEVMKIALKKNVEKTVKGILVNPIDNTINKPGETIREGLQNIKKLLPF